MRKAKKWTLILTFILCIALITVGCTPKAPSEPADGTTTAAPEVTSQEIAISTASAGGAWYPIGAAMADIINNQKIGVQARVQTTGGGVENVKLVNNGDTELGITISYLAYNGYNGIEPYPAKMENMRTLFSGLSTGVMQIVVMDNSKIQSISDLKGKKVAVGPAGGGALTALSDLCKEYGIKFSDINASYVSYDEGVTMMTDKQVDAAVVYAALPTPAIKTLEAQKKGFRMLTIDEAKLTSVLTKYPYYVSVDISKDMYGLSSDIKAIGTPNIVIVSKSVSDDMAYKMVSAFFEEQNLAKIQASHPSAKQLDLKNAALAPIPLHPGAEKYYKEKGIIQ